MTSGGADLAEPLNDSKEDDTSRYRTGQRKQPTGQAYRSADFNNFTALYGTKLIRKLRGVSADARLVLFVLNDRGPRFCEASSKVLQAETGLSEHRLRRAIKEAARSTWDGTPMLSVTSALGAENTFTLHPVLRQKGGQAHVGKTASKALPPDTVHQSTPDTVHPTPPTPCTRPYVDSPLEDPLRKHHPQTDDDAARQAGVDLSRTVDTVLSVLQGTTSQDLERSIGAIQKHYRYSQEHLEAVAEAFATKMSTGFTPRANPIAYFNGMLQRHTATSVDPDAKYRAQKAEHDRILARYDLIS